MKSEAEKESDDHFARKTGKTIDQEQGDSQWALGLVLVAAILLSVLFAVWMLTGH